MSKTLTVNNTPYEYPTPGDEPGWGEDATGWAEEVTDVLNDVLGSDDILETTFTIDNNISTPTNVTGLLFSTATVRAAEIDYSVYRRTDSSTSGNAESGKMTLIYDNDAAPGSKWSLVTYGIAGNAGVNFTITDAGQVQYESTNITGTNYSGTMKFRAKALGQ